MNLSRLPPLILNDIYRRLAKRLRNLPQVPKRKAREPGRPRRRRRGEVRRPQPVGLVHRALALPLVRVGVEGVRGAGVGNPRDPVDLCAEARGQGRRRPLGHDLLRDQHAARRRDLHGEGARDGIVPEEPARRGVSCQRGEGRAGVYDLELDVPDERAGPLQPFGACAPGELAGGACPVCVWSAKTLG